MVAAGGRVRQQGQESVAVYDGGNGDGEELEVGPCGFCLVVCGMLRRSRKDGRRIYPLDKPVRYDSYAALRASARSSGLN